MAKTLNQIGIATGNTVEANHVTQSIDAFTGAEAYDISLSGSFNMTGSINGEPGVINPLTASYAVTASYALDALSASYAPSALSASYALTASYVDLVAGDNVTINQVGTSFEISASAAGSGITPAETASFVTTASATNNVITFTQGDGSTFDVTVATGSTASTYQVLTTSGPGTAVTTFPTETIIASISIPANTFSVGDVINVKVMFLTDLDTTGYGRVYLNTSNNLTGSPKMILGEDNSAALSLLADRFGRGVERNLIISASNATLYPSFIDLNIPSTEYESSSPITNVNSVSPGFVTSNIDWTSQQYLLITGQLASSSGTNSIEIRYAKINN